MYILLCPVNQSTHTLWILITAQWGTLLTLICEALNPANYNSVLSLHWSWYLYNERVLVASTTQSNFYNCFAIAPQTEKDPIYCAPNYFYHDGDVAIFGQKNLNHPCSEAPQFIQPPSCGQPTHYKVICALQDLVVLINLRKLCFCSPKHTFFSLDWSV